MMASLLQAADIDVIGNSAYSQASFASADGGVDGGLGTNIRVITGTNVTWTKNNTYFVTDKLFIPRGATLTIEPGTKIYLSNNDNGTSSDRSDDKIGAIVACRGAKLIADGTASEPIVFTSIREWEAANGVDSAYDPDSNVGPAPTAADGGQWGGIILLGQAFVSFVNSTGVNAGTVQIEGFAPTGTASADGDSIPDATQYGTSTNFARNDADNSGVIRYVSIRHGGYEFATGKEINGLTLGGVGSGTIIENVEVYANQDDGIEFFGGTVNTKNIVMAFNQDDSFDIDEGYKGINQYWLCIQNPGDQDAGGEWDGVGGTSAGYATIGPVGSEHHARPRIYNATFIGAGKDNTLSQIPTRGTAGTKHVNWEKGNFALHIEDYFNGEIYNSVFHDFSAGLMKFNDAVSIGADAKFVNNHIGDMGVNTSSTVTAATNATAILGNASGISDARTKGFAPYNLTGVAQNGCTSVNTNPMFKTYTRNASNVLTALNPVPAAGSPLLADAVSPGAPTTANYRGAFGAENWASGWTKLSQSGLLQGTESGSDTVAPVITLLGANPLIINAGGLFTDPGATVTDNVDAVRTINGTGSVNTNIAGSYTVSYNAADAAGNAATTVTRTVNVVAADTVAPVITLLGANPLIINAGGSFTDPGATVTDNVDAVRTINGASNVNTNVSGNYTITYQTSDAAGNPSSTVTRAVVVTSTSANFVTSIGSPLDISNYFQTGVFATATVSVAGRLPAGLAFNPSSKLITGYPRAAGVATFNVTIPGRAPFVFTMNFVTQPLPITFQGVHALHTDQGDFVTITITNSASVSVAIQSPTATKAVSARGVAKFNSAETDPNRQWTIDIPTQQLAVTLPVLRTLKQSDGSYLGNYGAIAGKTLWGFKSSDSTGVLVLSKGSAKVSIVGTFGNKGSVKWKITPEGARSAITSAGRVSVDGIANIRVALPNSGLLMGMIRIDEETNQSGMPTGQLRMTLLQGFDGWIPVSYTLQ